MFCVEEKMRYKKSKSIKQIDNREKNLRRMSDKVIRFIEKKDSGVRLRLNEKKTERLLDKVKRRGSMIEFEIDKESIKYIICPVTNDYDIFKKLNGGRFESVAVYCIPVLKIYKLGKKTGSILSYCNSIVFSQGENKGKYTINTSVNVLLDVELVKHIFDENVRYSFLSSWHGTGFMMDTDIRISKASENKFNFKRETQVVVSSNSKRSCFTDDMSINEVVPRAEVEQIISALEKFQTIYYLHH